MSTDRTLVDMGQHVTVAIIGTGFSGLCMAIKLKEAGIDDFVLLERAGAIGGTWRDNTYPGCACDVPSHLYSLSFEPSASWSRAYAPQSEIRAYLERCFDKYHVRPHVRFHAKVVSAEFEDERWRIRIEGGEDLTADILVSGVGGLSNPAYPKLRGRERFRGEQFHSALWNHDYDLTGKRVAVIGTGASAIQFIPEIQPKVGQLTLFQRTAPWIIRRDDRAFHPVEKFLFEKVPAVRWLYRQKIYWQHEWRAFGFTIYPPMLKAAALMGKANIRRSIKNPELRKKVTPNYTPGCKRILKSDDYYQSLDKPNVEVLTTGIAEVKEHSIVTDDGREVPVDAIIYGTGFAVHEYIGPVQIRGRDGADLATAWKDGAEAYLGTTISGFPNLFMLTGPNTGLGHNSMVYMIESQVHYVMECIKLMRERSLSFVDVREDLQKQYNESLQNRLKGSVWSTGCASWYLNEQGKNTTLWPSFTFAFRARTRRFVPADYELGKSKLHIVKPKPKERATAKLNGRANPA
ncbi:NAD(P)/FAD-dependent oxidoreductase [Pendulispora rubella]|uniref:NAD(P)/FAD-dependent oxidoreductase n=1 Tax=Pendulispora rubella TaxID=2741070 RepID=A0ABZ2LBB7_9BACT